MNIIIILFLIILFVIIVNKTEHFDLYYKPIRHATLNHYNGVEYIDIRPPYENGDFSCVQTACPSIFQPDLRCWKCNEFTVNYP